ncbi:ArsR/SmtB family transcription factor [Sodalis sp.]|uniref:ArsR/SmtB family transcription factor n=1 Tax=Sodalis sp. (in: enterobacteria) TaxID=1898979 RepID=UPI003872AA48
MLLNIRQPSLSQHLAALRAAGLVYASRDAKSVTYALSEGLSSRLVAALSALVSEEALNPSALQPRQSEELAYSPRQGDELVFATLRSPNET